MAQPADLGDKKYVLPSLLAEFAGKVDLKFPWVGGFSRVAWVSNGRSKRYRGRKRRNKR